MLFECALSSFVHVTRGHIWSWIMRFGFGAAIGLLTAASAMAQPAGNDPLAKIGHIVVIFEENRSFDNFFGRFPGANGLANAGDKAIQIGPDAKPYKFLPTPINTNLKPPD